MKYFRSPLSLLLNVIVMVSLNSYASESMDHNKTIVPTSQQAQDSARRVLGLLGYIQGDYPAAIQNSQIKNELEYKELVSFTKAANQLLIKILAMTRTNQLSTKSIQVRKDLSHAMQQLERQIKARAPHSEVVRVTSMMNKALIAEFRIPHVPNETPNWAAAASLYNRSCTSCHGALGKGDGPAAKHLSPAPPNFTKSDTLHLASPFRFYNIVKDGIQGTAMPAFGKVFSDQQIWNLSFFLFTLVQTTSPSTSFDRSENSINERITQSLNLDFKKLATLSNKEIEEKIKDTLGTKLAHLNHHVEPIIRHIRRDTSFKPIADRSNKQSLTQDHLQHAIDKAENALQAIQANKRERAQELLLDSYLEGFEKAEAYLNVTVPEKQQKIESKYLLARTHVSSESQKQATRSIEVLLKEIKNLKVSIHKKKTKAGSGFISGFTIILREGIEAFLIISALLGLIGSAGAVRSRRWVHAGWATAIALGFLSFLAFEHLFSLSGAKREGLELVFTFFTAILLAYTGVWLSGKNPLKELRAKTQRALSGKKHWGLFAISFVAVYREAAETILFLTTLMQTSNDSFGVVAGIACGVFTLMIVVYLIQRLQVRLPLQRFFKITSIAMITLSVFLIGETLHTAIGIGLIQPIPIDVRLFDIEKLGIHPEFNTILAQLIAICGLFLVHRYSQHQKLGKHP